jgi:hypothetical protein
MADEKKIALVIQLRADGQGKAQEITINLKNLGAAHDGAAKKAKDHGSVMVDLTRKILGLLTIKEVIKVIKDVSRALVEMVQQAVAFQSEFAPLRVAFESAASKIKTSFASITTSALPAVTLLQQVLADALGDMANFVNANRELIATDLAGWAADGARFLLSAFSFAVNTASKSINGLLMAYHEAASFISFVQGDDKGADLHEGKAAKALSDMEDLDAKMASIEKRVGGYIDKAQKFAGEQAKKPVHIIDPDMVAKSEAAIDASISIIIERLGKLSTVEQAMSDVSFARYKLNEALKASTTADRTRNVEERLRALAALEESLQNKYQAKYIADLGAKAQADSDYYAKLRDLQQSQAEYQAELADKKATGAKTREPPKSLLSTAVAAQKVKSFVGPKTEEQVAKDESILQEHSDNIMDMAQQIGSGIGSIMAESIAAIASGTKTALEGLGGMLGGIIAMIGKMLIEMGTAALVVAAISAIAGDPRAGATAAAGAAAIAAGGIMLAAGTALNSAIGAADGGLVVGGTMGRDSVPAMLMPGEYVVPAAQVRQNVAAGRAPDDSGASGGRGGGGAVNINVSQQSFVPGTKADFNRSVREAVLPAIRQLARQGLLVLK